MTLTVAPDKTGNALRSVPVPASAMSDQTPFSERWGGWYVTGRHGTQRHRGNTTFSPGALLERMDWSKGANLDKLDGLIDTSPQRVLARGRRATIPLLPWNVFGLLWSRSYAACSL
jgi:hypothetical protein